MLNKYNSIAVFYSLLSKIVFGNVLINIQKQAVDQLPTRGKLLILGGGDGNILPYLFLKRPKLNLEYLEASSKMIELARAQSPRNQKITFIHSYKVIDCSSDVDLILAPFFFDLFSEQETSEIIYQLENKIDKPFSLFVTDFSLEIKDTLKLVRQIQIKLSILFFRFTVGHPLKYLPKVFHNIKKCGYKSLYSSHLQSGFVCLQIFSKA